ncbi:MAG: DUF1016 family protein [Bacteroidaceae bacterium]|nr:DUF1016 family protein [Bacteroidaceae bacterium]
MAEELVPIKENDYNELLLQTVAVIESARTSIARHIASTASNTYWEIGKLLHEKKIENKYGSSVVKRLSVDLKERYPKMGVSPRQLWNMKSFYTRYKDCDEKLLRSVALLTWSQNLLILSKNLSDADTMYYAHETVEKGWNRDLLLNAIKLGMHETHPVETSDNNFDSTLPAVQSQYANEVFHSTYNLGFLGVTKPILELELENRLVEKIKLFLLELGKGFTFIGNQHTIEYNGKESRVDMLFFHRGLRSLVAIDLKIGKFIPEYAGKMNYYLSLLDRTERQEGENPSIGIILCAEKDRLDVELALEGMTKPIGVADYQLIIPKEELQKTIAAEIQSFEDEHAKGKIDES